MWKHLDMIHHAYIMHTSSQLHIVTVSQTYIYTYIIWHICYIYSNMCHCMHVLLTSYFRWPTSSLGPSLRFTHAKKTGSSCAFKAWHRWWATPTVATGWRDLLLGRNVWLPSRFPWEKKGPTEHSSWSYSVGCLQSPKKGFSGSPLTGQDMIHLMQTLDKKKKKHTPHEEMSQSKRGGLLINRLHCFTVHLYMSPLCATSYLGFTKRW